ncbi:DUF1501 domain-containing protein [Desertivirga brevis]|uniref:DUF1501 domain-containing protein n=1 Tax=Desertivirga brevis TaxID=2810310 RepID=UPI001A96F0C8|nr:DUF1501 domain-containing protein [Pedobacter sp. SYSU D00873]
MKRRSFLKQGGLAAGALALPAVLKYLYTPEIPTGTRRLVMVHLKGGNDGYNTLIPYTDAVYYQSRPSLAISEKSVVKLDQTYGLHPAMQPVEDLYHSGNMLFLNAVAHPEFEASHHTAFQNFHPLQELEAGRGPWEDSFVNRNGEIQALPFLNVDCGRADFASLFNEAYCSFSAEDFSQGLERVSSSILSGADTRIYHLSLDGFDTHQMQTTKHNLLLKAYAEGMQRFVERLKDTGLFEDTLILTYSEFGRSLKENKKRGTEHGNENCAWLIGGKLKESRVKNLKNSSELSNPAVLLPGITAAWFDLRLPLLDENLQSQFGWV